MNYLPIDIARDWRAGLIKANHPAGTYELIGVRRTQPTTWEELKVIVHVVDESGFALPGVKVAFSYSTANQYYLDETYTWSPPQPWRADVFPTRGSGEIEHVQGSVVKEGEPGGITVYILDPELASDIVTGVGALPDHTGLYLTVQRRRVGVRSIQERLADVEARLNALERTG